MTDKRNEAGRTLPTAKEEDVEFARERADADDLEALERAEAADRRAAEYEGT
ncbi:YfhD family protein [Cohnella sp. REN36]|uniref:YfhD family protein n=1 Tax=Cohnella sp. REN36 TaxID=2887347 RepID=UPI001D159C03|nr:YfhD family protein [Cohnella sp. REN36]MCC3372777.1 YfhD family protein [Cohnella sp. REN36]